ncbi:hypothetical protein MPL3365_140185 [Mesorhizobium plurifarium]|uniref:Uncharacterized protein n=1 Tax=Mesorhizobium plurifarium TaxID=69974 RepID=A0A090GT40_MESPL|nr:hypothetical protein MPL3365_140185 [Mesorhizobium plurifarium]
MRDLKIPQLQTSPPLPVYKGGLATLCSPSLQHLLSPAGNYSRRDNQFLGVCRAGAVMASHHCSVHVTRRREPLGNRYGS